MTQRDAPFAVGEWYHCYNRSIEKRIAFADARDYQRFLELLYLANEDAPLRHDAIGDRTFEEVLAIPRGERLVAIGAFCLLPGHFHLVLKEVSKGGITAFMRKIGTAYPLYFNSRYGREGNIFLKPFRSRKVTTEQTIQQLVSYVHSNPAALFEPEWKKSHVVDPQFLGERIAAYPYSSLRAYMGLQTPIRTILDADMIPVARTVALQKMLQEARKYCVDLDIP